MTENERPKRMTPFEWLAAIQIAIKLAKELLVLFKTVSGRGASERLEKLREFHKEALEAKKKEGRK